MNGLRRATIGLAVFVVLAVAMTYTVFATLHRDVTGPTNTYTAVFGDVSGLSQGDDVRVAGVRVGRVDRIELSGTEAVVTFRVQRDQTLYDDTVASVTYQDIIGQRYLGLTAGPASRVPLVDGARIPLQHTNSSFDISYMLNAFEPLFTELDPEQVDNLTNAIVAAFQGDQVSLLTLTTQASTLAATLAGPEQVLGDLIANLDGLMVSVAEQSANLQSTLEQSRAVIAQMADQRDSLVTSGGSVTQSVDRLSAIMAAITPDMQQFIARDPGFLGHLLTDGRARFGYLAANLPLLLKGMARTSQEGSYLNLYPCDVDFGLWRGLFHWFRAFVMAATPGNGNEVWHTPVCR